MALNFAKEYIDKPELGKYFHIKEESNRMVS